MEQPLSRRPSFTDPMPRRRLRAVTIGLMLAAGVSGGVALGAARGEPDLMRELARAAPAYGVPGIRLTVASGLGPCAEEESRENGFKARPCGGASLLSKRTATLMRRAAEAAREGTDPEALHMVAVANLLFGTPSGKHLDQSISYLQSASRLAEKPAPPLADLAGAHLIRAERAQTPQDLFKALDAALRALEHEPANLTALFNAAEALERIGLPRQASEAWTAYLRADPGSDWARHASSRLRQVRRSAVPPRAPARSAPPAEMAAYAAAAPKEARELGWDELLGEWGAAVLAGDSTTAHRRLKQVEVLGRALAARGGDTSLADAAAEIRQHADKRGATHRLAQAHVHVAAGRRALLATNDIKACPLFERAYREVGASVVAEWARTFAGICSVNTPGANVRRELSEMAAHTDSARYPAMAGRRWLALGTALYRAGRYEEALAPYSRAAALFTRAGERQYAGSALMSAGNAQVELGNADAGYRSLHQAGRVLRGYQGSLGLYNLLFALRNALLADGLSHAAMRVQDEAVAVAEQMPSPSYVAETRLARARLHLAVGRRDVDADVNAALRILETMDGRFMTGWLQADLRQTLAEEWLAARPARSATELAPVIEYFAGTPHRLVPALLARAEAWMALGRYAAARADLERAAAVVGTQRAHVNSAQLRASLLEQSRRVFDRAVMLSVRAQRPEQALEYVEQSRASFSPVARREGWDRRPLRAPPGQVAVEFALIGDTLLAWTLWEGGLHLTRRTVGRAALLKDVERVRSGLERGAPDAAVHPTLEALYDRLLRPVSARLGPRGTPLVVVGDGELSSIPLTALRDRETGRFLVEDHPVRFASSLRDPVLAPAVTSAGTPVTIVADPAFDPAAFPELQRLPGAALEARVIARLHPGARTLSGTQAGEAAIRAALGRGGVAHFAGHAVFDDARPDRSFLVAAPGGEPEPARLAASEIEQMRLGSLRLVVLSACQTSRAAAGRSGGFAGLSGAFLAAGAGGVVGSLWRVDDAHTRVLMEHFHRAYRTSGNAAAALRTAQLQMLGSADPALRSPAAWAGFRYAGG